MKAAAALLPALVVAALLGCGAKTGLDPRPLADADADSDADADAEADADADADAAPDGDGLELEPPPAPAASWLALFERPEEARFTSALALADGGALLIGTIQRLVPPGQRLWLVRLHANGGILWQREHFEGSGDVLSGACETASGDLVVVGATTTFGSLGSRDGWVLRLSARGEPRWQVAVGGAQTDELRDVVETPTGELVALGVLDTGTNRTAAWVLTFSAGGELLRQLRLGEHGFSEGTALEVDEDGALYGVGLYDPVGDPLRRELWAFRLDAAGELAWQRSYGQGSSAQASTTAGWQEGALVVTFEGRAPELGQLALALGRGEGEARWQLRCDHGGERDQAPWAAALGPDGALLAVGGFEGAAWLAGLPVGGGAAWKRQVPLPGGHGLELRAVASLGGGRVLGAGSTRYPSRSRPGAAIALFEAGGRIEACDTPVEASLECEELELEAGDLAVEPVETLSTPRPTEAVLSPSDYAIEYLCP